MRSGTISLIFFVIEFVMLIIMSNKNRKHPFFKTLFSVIILLQIYQLTEFLLCIGVNVNITSRIAFASISFLPPTGYLLATRIVGWNHKDYWIWFIIGIGFSLFYLISPESVELVDCNPLYAIYLIPQGYFYGIYYFGCIFCSIGLLTYFIHKNLQYNVKKYSIWTIIGYISFLLPMGITVFFVKEEGGSTIPSIMCKYAIILAILLFFYSFQYENKQTED